MELALAVKGGHIPNDVIEDVLLFNMCGYDECMVFIQEVGGKLIASAIGFF